MVDPQFEIGTNKHILYVTYNGKTTGIDDGPPIWQEWEVRKIEKRFKAIISGREQEVRHDRQYNIAFKLFKRLTVDGKERCDTCMKNIVLPVYNDTCESCSTKDMCKGILMTIVLCLSIGIPWMWLFSHCNGNCPRL